MKAITIRQPWAGAIFELGKDVENRGWLTHHRGPLAIHAGGSICSALRTGALCMCKRARTHGTCTGCSWSLSAIIGVVDLIDVVPGYASEWTVAPGYQWVLENPRRIDPIRMSGQRGLWSTNQYVSRQIVRRLKGVG